MSNNNLNDQENQEIDLGIIFKKIGEFFDKIALSIFKCILFFKKNALILISLIVIGAGLGYFLDSNNNSYDNEIIISPNMGGTDYLYSKVELLSTKIKEKDYIFFKKIGIQNPEKIASIKVEPIIDIYSFVNNNTAIASNAQNTQNFEVVKLLAENSDINKVIKDKLTSKNYPHHTIKIITIGRTTLDKTINPIMKYLNTDDYLNKLLEVSNENIIIKMKKNEQTIKQVDSLIKQITYNLGNRQHNPSLVYNSENNQVNSLFDFKNNLINELAGQRIQLINHKTFIRDLTTIINKKKTDGLNGKMKFVIPFIFIFIFILIIIFRNFYNSQLKKLNQA